SAIVGADPVANARGRPRAHIGLHQDCKQLAQKIFIDEPPLALEKIANVGIEQVMRFLERRPQLAKPTLLGRGLRGFRCWRRSLPCPGRWLIYRLLSPFFE